MDATNLLRLRKDLKQSIPDLTLLPFFMKALSLSLNEFPELNSIVDPMLNDEGYIE